MSYLESEGILMVYYLVKIIDCYMLEFDISAILNKVWKSEFILRVRTS